jgi:RNase P subunit RPR2
MSAATESLSERLRKAVRNASPSPDFEELTRDLAARFVEAREERERREAVDAKRLDAAIQWIESKWGEQACPYCQHVEWQVGTPLEITVAEGEVMSPAFPVMCGNCGHTTFVNAIKAGLLSEPDEAEE